MRELKIIVPENFKKFGEKVNKHINKMRDTDINYLTDIDLVRFNDGEGKAVIKDSMRDKDLYILTDVTNHDIAYKCFGKMHYMSRDEHFQDIKRILSAECGHAAKRTIIMPYLYQGRQDKKDSRESLDCAVALQELEHLGANEIVTCDVHNKGVMNAVPNLAFENVYLGDMLLWDLLRNERINFNDVVFISPDSGAVSRTNFFADLIGGAPVGTFTKQRDYSVVIDGKNPIVDHRFLGPSDMSGKVAIVTDDMIASGGSILDTAESLKRIGANRIYLMVTFALFTSGIEKFQYYYDKGIIDRVYASDVCYVPDEIKNMDWFNSVDCSDRLAYIINELNYGRSIGNIIKGNTTEAAVKIKKLRREYETR